jgi:hypothetical protein
MKIGKKKVGGVPFTAEHARIFRTFFQVLDGRYGDEAQDYTNQYLKLTVRSYELEEMGLKARVVLPNFPRRRLLIISKRRG